jgi:CheY-like chemotaxis protein
MSQPVMGKIMTIGFDAHFLYLLRRYIVMSSYQHIFARNDEDVLTIAKCDKPVLILIEIGPPNSPTWNIVHRLKSDQHIDRIPVVVCSWQDEEQRSIQEGADGYLHMPILYDNFTSTLAKVGLNSQTA